MDEWAAALADFGPRFSRANQPVVGVNWFEAAAFCHWLKARLRQAGELSQAECITLPSERQWEKVARGESRRSGGRGAGARIYPWGDEPDPNRANYDDTKIGATSTVGCFPGGINPDGVEDLVGNVWEWCRTRW